MNLEELRAALERAVLAGEDPSQEREALARAWIQAWSADLTVNCA